MHASRRHGRRGTPPTRLSSGPGAAPILPTRAAPAPQPANAPAKLMARRLQCASCLIIYVSHALRWQWQCPGGPPIQGGPDRPPPMVPPRPGRVMTRRLDADTDREGKENETDAGRRMPGDTNTHARRSDSVGLSRPDRRRLANSLDQLPRPTLQHTCSGYRQNAGTNTSYATIKLTDRRS